MLSKSLLVSTVHKFVLTSSVWSHRLLHVCNKCKHDHDITSYEQGSNTPKHGSNCDLTPSLMFRSQHHNSTATNIERNVFMTRVDTCLSSWDKLSKETKQQLRQNFAQHESSVTPSWFIAALRTNVVPTRRTHTSLPSTSIYVYSHAYAYPKKFHRRTSAHAVKLWAVAVPSCFATPHHRDRQIS